MGRLTVKGWLYTALLILFLLHQDFWFWDDARLVGGLPVGLAYHIAYCVAVAGLFALLIRFAWPAGLESSREEGGSSSSR